MLLFVILGAKVIKRCKLCKKKQSIFRILMYLCAQHKVTLHMNIRMNIILSAGIIIAKYGYDQMPPVLWLILLLDTKPAHPFIYLYVSSGWSSHFLSGISGAKA